jgi:hypothetical protein
MKKKKINRIVGEIEQNHRKVVEIIKQLQLAKEN